MKKILTLVLMTIFFITLSGFAKTDYIFVGTSGEVLYKIDGYDNIIWRYEGHNSAVEGVYVLEDGSSISSGNNGSIHYVDKDGNQVWVNSDHNLIVREIDYENGFVYTASADDTVNKINVTTGITEWTYSGHTNDVYDVNVNNDFIYTASRDNTVHKIDLDGNNIWTYSFNVGTRTWSVDADNNNNVYASNDSAVIHKIDENGNFIISSSSINFAITLFVKDNYLYTGESGSGKLSKLDLDLNTIWSNENAGNTINGIYVTDNDFVYASSQDGNIYKISPNNTLLWEKNIDTNSINGIFVIRDYRYDSTTTGLIYLLPTIYTIIIISGGFVFAIVRKNENRMKSILETAIFIVLGLSLLPIIIAIGKW